MYAEWGVAENHEYQFHVGPQQIDDSCITVFPANSHRWHYMVKIFKIAVNV